MIKHLYIIVLISGIVAYFAMKWVTKNDKLFQQLFLNTMFNAVFIWFFTFKFSTIIFQPDILINNPFSILYFTGGTKGSILGLLLAIIYVIFSMKKKEIGFKKWFTAFVYGIVTFFISFWLLRSLFLIFF